MANVNIKFNGKEFLLSCDDGQEEHLEELSVYLNEKFNNLKNSLGNIGENKLLLITSIKVMDEYFETKNKIEKQKIELNNITERFKELKSLVYEYKDNKEKEIQTLMDLHDNLKKEVEDVNESYSKIIDDTTKEIDDFVDKINADSSVQ